MVSLSNKFYGLKRLIKSNLYRLHDQSCDKFHVKNDNAKIFVSFCYSGYRIHVIILYALIRGLNHLKDFFEIHEAIKSAPVVTKFSVYMYHHY